MNTQEKVALLRRTQRRMLTQAGEYDQYATAIPSGEEKGCVCCFLVREAGWTDLTADAIYEKARDILVPEPVDELFSTESWPQEFVDRLDASLPGSTEAAQVGVDIIERFIKTYYNE